MRYATHIASWLLVLLAFGACTSAPPQAQGLEAGLWTGEVIGPDGRAQEITYEVAVEDGALMISLVAAEVGRIPFEDIRLEGGTLVFSWEAGVPLDCSLDMQGNGNYEGLCEDAQGTTGQMVMRPPQGITSAEASGQTPVSDRESRRADLGPLSAGEIHWGEGRYIEYKVGALPLILSAPHGGTLTPREIRDRTQGYTIGDSDTEELTRLIAEALVDLTGRAPHVIISRLARKKLDPNRELQEAANGDAVAERAWFDYHGFIDVAKEEVTSAWGSGLYLDIHGHGHRTPWVELGYVVMEDVLNGSDEALNAVGRHTLRALAEAAVTPVAELVRGPKSLGGLLEARGYRAVPSPGDPGPGRASYFNGGYSTMRHGSFFKGTISSIQLEHPKRGVRDTAANRRVYARHLAEALVEFMETHYGFSLSSTQGLQ